MSKIEQAADQIMKIYSTIHTTVFNFTRISNIRLFILNDCDDSETTAEGKIS